MLTTFRNAILKNLGQSEINQIIADSKFHRFHINEDKTNKKNGWYILYDTGQGLIAGAYGCWKRGVTYSWCNKKINAINKSALKQSRLKIKQQLAQRYLAAKEKAAAIMNKAQKQTHPYLIAKGLQQKAWVYKKILIVPVYNSLHKLSSLQFISATGEKRFLAGGRIQECYYMIGKPEQELYICEGYATGLTIYNAAKSCVVVAFNANNLLAVTKNIKTQYPQIKIIICGDNDSWTAGNPGAAKAKQAAQETNSWVVIPQFKNISNKPTDFNDLMLLEGIDEVRKQLAANAIEPKENPDDAARRLAKLSLLEYEQVRMQEAEKLNVRVIILDQEVKKYQQQKNADNFDDELENGIETWGSPVNSNELITEIKSLFDKHVILSESQSITLSLWVIATYCFDVFNIFPRLLINSPEKRCGKTTLMQLLHGLAHRALSASNVTSAAIFRSVEMWQPTLLIDEADTFIRDSEELRGIINSGHNKSGAYVLRVEGDSKKREPKRYSTWSPMAIAMIKNPPDTILDRSIVISLRRKLSNEFAERLNIKLFEALKPLRQKIKKWADDNTEQLKTNRPQVPNINNDRAADNWFPLFAVAVTLGDKWFKNAELALQQLNISDIAEESVATMLLADVKHIFEAQQTDKIHSDDLVNSLNELEERPWNEWKNNKPLTKNSLAKLLKPFGVKPKQLRIDKDNKNGYHLLNLKDTFARYLPNTPVQSSATLQPSVDKGCGHLQNSTGKLSVEFCKPPEANTVAACRGVEVQKRISNDQI